MTHPTSSITTTTISGEKKNVCHGFLMGFRVELTFFAFLFFS